MKVRLFCLLLFCRSFSEKVLILARISYLIDGDLFDAMFCFWNRVWIFLKSLSRHTYLLIFERLIYGFNLES